MNILKYFALLMISMNLGLNGCTETEDEQSGDLETDSDLSEKDAGDSSAEQNNPGDDLFCPVINYASCGGDLVGTWNFRAVCPDDPAAAAALCEHPYDDRPVCTGNGNEAICDGTHSGTLTFKSDGSLDIETTVTLVVTHNFTDECLAAVIPRYNTAEERCADLNNNQRLSCTYNTQCKCVSEPIVESDSRSGSYTIADGDLILGDDPPASYCIDGERLTMDYYLYHPVSWRYWILERK